jgi:hypothetical protein
MPPPLEYQPRPVQQSARLQQGSGDVNVGTPALIEVVSAQAAAPDLSV